MGTTEATGTHRILLVAAEDVNVDELRRTVGERHGERELEVILVAPAIDQSSLEHVMGDVDEATDRARERLERAEQELKRNGIEPVESQVGDSDLHLAIQDALQRYGADEIVIVAARDGGPSLQKQWIEDSERDFEQPITEIFVDADAGDSPRATEVERKPAGQQSSDPGEAEGESANLPPYSPRDLLGIAVAVIGTIVLVILAATGDGGELTSFSNQSARILIAGAAGLINLAHVIGLTLFQAGPHRGFGRELFAKMSLYGTPLAIVASALLLITE